MWLEQSSTNVGEHQFSDTVHNKADPFFKLLWWRAVFYGHTEEFLEVLQWELVHWINQCQVSDNEI